MPGTIRKHALHEHVEKRLQGAKPSDISVRARAVLWSHLVHELTELQDWELDETYVEPNRPVGQDIDSKTQVFWKIRRFGIDPHWHITPEALARRAERAERAEREKAEKKKATKGGATKNKKTRKPQRQFSVVERLAEMDKTFLPCKMFYFARLWDLVGPKRPSTATIKEIISNRMDDALLMRTVLSSPIPWSKDDLLEGEQEKATDGISHREAVEYLLPDKPNADDIAFFGALYLEAFADASLDIAVVLRDAIRWTTTQFIKQNNIEGFPRLLLECLVEERLIKQRWEDVLTPAELRRAEERLDALAGQGSHRYGHAGLKVVGYALLDARERNSRHNIPHGFTWSANRPRLRQQRPLYTKPAEAIQALEQYFAPDPPNPNRRKGPKAKVGVPRGRKRRREIIDIADLD